MKKVLHKQTCNPAKGTKFMSITQRSEDEECFTQVVKSFRYKVSHTAKMEPENKAPEIFITKQFDTKRGIEKFAFEVHGVFYMSYNRVIYRVDFKHILDIQIRWKSKIFSPKKSGILA